MPGFNDTHPELQEGEVFLFNASDIPPYPDEDPFVLCELETKRLGVCAYRQDGIVLPGTRPVFAMKWELENMKTSWQRTLGDMYGNFLDWIFDSLDRMIEKREAKKKKDERP